jgi:hypothetical protein
MPVTYHVVSVASQSSRQYRILDRFSTPLASTLRLIGDAIKNCSATCFADRLHPSVHLYAAFLAEQDSL